jgi:hypothetical protein
MNNENANNIIATDSDVNTAGAISYWRLSGDVDLNALTGAWAAAGLDTLLLPEPPSGRVALSRALRDIDGKVTDNTRRQAIKAQGGWWGVLEIVSDANGHIHTNQVCRARYNTADQKIEVADAYFSLEQQIRAAAVTHRGRLAPSDVSAWLIKVADARSALGLRDSGGIYFVPRTHVDFWAKVADVLASVGDHKIFRIPALKTDEAVDAIIDAVTQEANKAAELLTANLLAEGDDAPGTRALGTMAKDCQAKLDKIRHYEDLVGVKLPDVVAKVQALAAKVAKVTQARAAGITDAAEALAGPVSMAALVDASA